MIKFGIVSISSIVPRFIEGVRHSQYGEVVAVASRSLSNAQDFAKAFKIAKAYGNYEELLADDTIDAIYVAGANFTHYESCRLAIKAGKHVLCEKPMVLKSVEAKELFQLAKENHVLLMEASKTVFLPYLQKVKELIKSNQLGKIHYVEMCSSFPMPQDPNHWMLGEAGGCLYGSAIYTIQVMSYLFDAQITESHAQFIFNERGCDVQCSLALQLGDIQVNSVISMIAKNLNRAIIYGEKGRIEIKNYWKARSFTIINEEELKYDFPCNSEFTYEIDHFIDCVKKGLTESPIVSEYLSVMTCEIIEKLKG